MSFEVRVDLTNPGQFFACCGLFELASRLDPSATAHFHDSTFRVAGLPELDTTIQALLDSSFVSDVDAEPSIAPIQLRSGWFSLRIDWWTDIHSGGARLKTWAGQQKVGEIAREMRALLGQFRPHGSELFDQFWTPPTSAQKTEPFYFDSRRGANAHAREVGFSVDRLGLLTGLCPSIELLALIGIQRCRPGRDRNGLFRYRAWSRPLPLNLAGAVVAPGEVPIAGRLFQFENWARSGYYRAFLQSVPLSEGD